MFTRTFVALALVAGLAAPAFSQAKPETDEQKTIYSIGVALAQSLQPYYLTPRIAPRRRPRRRRRRPRASSTRWPRRRAPRRRRAG